MRGLSPALASKAHRRLLFGRVPEQRSRNLDGKDVLPPRASSATIALMTRKYYSAVPAGDLYSRPADFICVRGHYAVWTQAHAERTISAVRLFCP